LNEFVLYGNGSLWDWARLPICQNIWMTFVCMNFDNMGEFVGTKILRTAGKPAPNRNNGSYERVESDVYVHNSLECVLK